jgi:hypothetical protein
MLVRRSLITNSIIFSVRYIFMGCETQEAELGVQEARKQGKRAENEKTMI